MNKRFFLAVFLFLIAIGIVSYARSYTMTEIERDLPNENVASIKNIK